MLVVDHLVAAAVMNSGRKLKPSLLHNHNAYLAGEKPLHFIAA